MSESVRFPCAIVVPNGLRALDVDVDPLVVAAQLRELVDHLLRHLAPAARADELALERFDLLDPVRDRLVHRRRELHCASFHRRRPLSVLRH
jgi:hypothetical protein